MNTLENDRDLTKNFGNLNMDGDQELEEDLTLRDYLRLVPLFVFEEVAKYLTPKELRNLQTVDPCLKDRCKAASSLITYHPFDISLEDGRVIFQGDIEETVLTAEEFKNSKYKANTQHVHLGILTDEALTEIMEVFDRRVQAVKLSITEICCDVYRLSMLIADLKISTLDVGHGFFANIKGSYFPIELSQHPVMNQVTSLRIGVSLKNYSLDDFLKKNYRKFGVTCDESSDKAVAQTLHKVLEEWLQGQREIDDYTIAGVDLSGHTNTLLLGYSVIDEEEEHLEHNIGKRPLVVSLIWDDEEEEVYKLIRNDNNELYIHLHAGTITLDKDRPIDIEYGSELFDDLGELLSENDITYSDFEDYQYIYGDDDSDYDMYF